MKRIYLISALMAGCSIVLVGFLVFKGIQDKQARSRRIQEAQGSAEQMATKTDHSEDASPNQTPASSATPSTAESQAMLGQMLSKLDTVQSYDAEVWYGGATLQTAWMQVELPDRIHIREMGNGQETIYIGRQCYFKLPQGWREGTGVQAYPCANLRMIADGLRSSKNVEYLGRGVLDKNHAAIETQIDTYRGTISGSPLAPNTIDAYGVELMVSVSDGLPFREIVSHQQVSNDYYTISFSHYNQGVRVMSPEAGSITR